jgi:hypothetical protein
MLLVKLAQLGKRSDIERRVGEEVAALRVEVMVWVTVTTSTPESVDVELGEVEVGLSVVDEEVVEVSVEVGVWATGSAKTVTTGSIVVVCVTTTTASPAAVVGEATETGNITLLSLGIVDVEDPAVNIFEMRDLPAPFPKFKLI